MEVITYAKHLNAKVEAKHDNGSVTEYVSDEKAFIGFTKPDKATFNPMGADGYRRPSSYNCKAISRVGNGSTGFITYSLEGTGSYGVTEYSFTGDQAASVARNLENIPKTPNVNALRSKILNNVRAEVLDVAMVLAEMQSTTNTIVNGLARIGRSLNAVKKGNPHHYAYLLSGRTKDNRRPTDKFLRESSGVYLEWKYGIMPTVNDVASACKAMDMNENGSFWDNPPLLVGRASEIIDSTSTSNVRFRAVNGFMEQQLKPITLSARAEYKARIDYSVRGEGLRGLNRYGVGLSSIPTVLFDRTPFSFVLNMAFPISELIKAWTALQGCEVRGYCETLHKRITFPRDTFRVNLWPVSIPCTVTLLKQPDWVSWERRAFSTVPMPVPYVRNPIKTGNLATVLALFTQLRKPS